MHGTSCYNAMQTVFNAEMCRQRAGEVRQVSVERRQGQVGNRRTGQYNRMRVGCRSTSIALCPAELTVKLAVHGALRVAAGENHKNSGRVCAVGRVGTSRTRTVCCARYTDGEVGPPLQYKNASRTKPIAGVRPEVARATEQARRTVLGKEVGRRMMASTRGRRTRTVIQMWGNAPNLTMSELWCGGVRQV